MTLLFMTAKIWFDKFYICFCNYYTTLYRPFVLLPSANRTGVETKLLLGGMSFKSVGEVQSLEDSTLNLPQNHHHECRV
jgi:hypothetical protein